MLSRELTCSLGTVLGVSDNGVSTPLTCPPENLSVSQAGIEESSTLLFNLLVIFFVVKAISCDQLEALFLGCCGESILVAAGYKRCSLGILICSYCTIELLQEILDSQRWNCGDLHGSRVNETEKKTVRGRREGWRRDHSGIPLSNCHSRVSLSQL